MTAGEQAALTVAVIALVVSVLAAGFAGWQAITAHLARTRQPPAKWSVSYPGERHAWLLHNTGGSIASDISVRVRYPIARSRGFPNSERTFRIGEPIGPGGSASVPGSSRYDPRQLSIEHPDMPGRYEDFPDGAPADAGVYLVDEHAVVTWTDYRDVTRSARVRLR